ncbi:MAG TPA: OmpA family protein [Gammaproteobacteria bacterium]|nr:OmpA family protein [Gammaproteobacteria bacterium]
MNRNTNKVLVTFAFAGMLVLAGCASGPKKAPMAGSAPAAGSTAGALGAGMGNAQAIQAGPQSSYQNRTVYFDFNQSVVKPQYFPLLKAQAAYLVANSGASVVLQGYCDDRGTWDYNIGLGSRRAVAVQRFLELQGVSDSQIKTISYGEAYPADSANNEAAWAQNRRVVIVFGTTPAPTATP